MPQPLDDYRRDFFDTLPNVTGANADENQVLQQLAELGIKMKKQELNGMDLIIFIYKDFYFPISTCLSNPSLIEFLKVEFKIR